MAAQAQSENARNGFSSGEHDIFAAAEVDQKLHAANAEGQRQRGAKARSAKPPVTVRLWELLPPLSQLTNNLSIKACMKCVISEVLNDGLLFVHQTKRLRDVVQTVLQRDWLTAGERTSKTLWTNFASTPSAPAWCSHASRCGGPA